MDSVTGTAPAALRRAIARFGARPDALSDFDAFIRSVGFLSGKETCALIVAGDEIMDNLLTHGEISEAGVIVLVRKRSSGVTLAFFVDSHRGFADFSALFELGETSGPRFDELERRWRGLGLTMCRNIVTRMAYRPGSFIDRIFLSFTA